MMHRKKSSLFPDAITTAEAADLLDVSLRWFFVLKRNGILPKPARTIGKSLIWDKNAIMKTKLSKRKEKRKK